MPLDSSFQFPLSILCREDLPWINPISKKSQSGCAPYQGFKNIQDNVDNVPVYELKLEKNKFANLYNLGFGILLLYIVYNITSRHN